MTKIHHINCGALRGFPNDPAPRSIVHCLLLEQGDRLILIDSGFGLEEMRHSFEMLGKEAVEFWGIEGDEKYTAASEAKRLGLNPESVTDIVLTHADVDHAGGLADFPDATIHVSDEEHHAVVSGNPRYVARQFSHGPKFQTYSQSSTVWNGLEARELNLGTDARILFIPLFGHTVGHCGVAIGDETGWLLHAGDSYYRRVEVDNPAHPIASMAERFAADNLARLEALLMLRQLAAKEDLEFFSAHDYGEYRSTENPLNAAQSAGA